MQALSTKFIRFYDTWKHYQWLLVISYFLIQLCSVVKTYPLENLLEPLPTTQNGNDTNASRPTTTFVKLNKRDLRVYTLNLDIVLDGVTKKEDATSMFNSLKSYVEHLNLYLRNVANFPTFILKIDASFTLIKEKFRFSHDDIIVMQKLRDLYKEKVVEKHDGMMLLSRTGWSLHGGIAAVGFFCNKVYGVGALANFNFSSKYSRNSFLHEVFHLLNVKHDEDYGRPECKKEFMMSENVPHSDDVKISSCTKDALTLNINRFKCLQKPSRPPAIKPVKIIVPPVKTQVSDISSSQKPVNPTTSTITIIAPTTTAVSAPLKPSPIKVNAPAFSNNAPRPPETIVVAPIIREPQIIEVPPFSQNQTPPQTSTGGVGASNTSSGDAQNANPVAVSASGLSTTSSLPNTASPVSASLLASSHQPSNLFTQGNSQSGFFCGA
ncbi:hypothetical protein HMI54_008228 [Coelomomyces lativittatus]|nr:hypothetical protein HMI56_006217 [Coelomomyces lativittatus]KAJ1516788.1 hypothetical protein HMI54_008228 [Coelomomyces lativittatus]